MRTALVLLALLGLGGLAIADPPVPGAPPAEPPTPAAPVSPAPAVPAPAAKPAPPLTPEQAADAVLVALKVKDDATLKDLAAKDDPDPWLVADELIRRGEHDVAEAFAKAAPRVDVENLPEYVASRRGKTDDQVARDLLAAANVALRTNKSQEALAAAGLPDAAMLGYVAGIRLAFARGVALQGLVRLQESANSFLIAADAAERIGWASRASAAVYQAGSSSVRRSDYPGALAAWERCLKIDEVRGAQAGVARALGSIGTVLRSLGEYTRSLATQDRALKTFEALGDKRGAAQALSRIGNVYQAMGEYEKALATYRRALTVSEELGDKEGSAYTLTNIGGLYSAQGKIELALATSERALAMQQELGNKAAAAAIMGNIAAACQDILLILDEYSSLRAGAGRGEDGGARIGVRSGWILDSWG